MGPDRVGVGRFSAVGVEVAVPAAFALTGLPVRRACATARSTPSEVGAGFAAVGAAGAAAGEAARPVAELAATSSPPR
ncbi:hypothetical protein OG559_01525 [Micromonospora sp. NBC_01405]|uniref:hypothetical protein n=1 Tax=Micromonospora sp. NBC_01405 TaxID=2903589 RepID=UPI003243C561